MINRPITERLLIGLLGCLIVLTSLACGANPATIARTPGWACPSPQPLPYGAAGPIKDLIRHTRPISEGGNWDEPVYYEIWEQEYGHLGGPPFPAPTTYALQGTNYTFGQRVAIWPLHVLVDARAGAVVQAPGIAAESQQLYLIDLTWYNHTRQPIAIAHDHILLRAIIDPHGALISDGHWGMTARALELANLSAPAMLLPPGESRMTVPILAPPGEPEAVELQVWGDPSYQPDVAMPPVGPGTPSPTSMPTMSPMVTRVASDLRAPAGQPLSIRWSNAVWRAPGAPICQDPGAMTDWSSESSWGMPIPLVGVSAPAGRSRLIQIALNQVGKPYVWGAKGPEQFDCSGLVSWAYAQIGIDIPQGTAGQWPNLAVADPTTLMAGDLVFFDMAGSGRIDHVGMLIGDLDGNGQSEMVHAASPPLGVRLVYDLLTSQYYAPRIRGYRTVH